MSDTPDKILLLMKRVGVDEATARRALAEAKQLLIKAEAVALSTGATGFWR